jgi:hypothetical protein
MRLIQREIVRKKHNSIPLILEMLRVCPSKGKLQELLATAPVDGIQLMGAI